MRQRVWLSTKDLLPRTGSRKLAPRFVGPFPIERIISSVAVQLSLPWTVRLHPTFHVSRIKPVLESPLSPVTPQLPPCRLNDGGLTCTVRHIIHSRRRGKGLQSLVEWEGYSPEERSWVPSRHILDKSLIREFHQLHLEQPTQPSHPLHIPSRSSLARFDGNLFEEYWLYLILSGCAGWPPLLVLGMSGAVFGEGGFCHACCSAAINKINFTCVHHSHFQLHRLLLMIWQRI